MYIYIYHVKRADAASAGPLDVHRYGTSPGREWRVRRLEQEKETGVSVEQGFVGVWTGSW